MGQLNRKQLHSYQIRRVITYGKEKYVLYVPLVHVQFSVSKLVSLLLVLSGINCIKHPYYDLGFFF